MALDPEENKLYAKASDLHSYHWERLTARPPEEAASAAGASYANGVFTLPVCGKILHIDPAARKMTYADAPQTEPGYQRGLVAIVGLYASLDAPESGNLVSPRELPGGQGFYRGPHALPTAPLVKKYGTDIPAFRAVAEKSGGIPAQGGDASYIFRMLPKISVQIVLWSGDQELPGEAAILIESRANLSLPLDVLWAGFNVIVHEITHQFGT